MPSDGFEAALLSLDAPVPTSIKGKSERRFAVYRNNVVVGLVRAMESNFPAIQKLLGEVYFTGLARAFVMRHPPQCPLMFTYGDAFPAFLAAQDDLQNYPYLHDVAQVEILMRQSHHATDVPVLSVDALSCVPPDRLDTLRLVPHPAVRLFTSAYAAGSITLANRPGGELHTVDPATPETVIITRPSLEVHVTTVDAGAAAFLSLLLRGEALGQAAATVLQHHPELVVGHCLGLGLVHGLFASLHGGD